MTKQINILSTKKLLPNQRQLLVDANILVIEENFIETKSKSFELSKVNDNLIFSSQNAVKSVLNHPKQEELKLKNVICVGLKAKTGNQ